MTLYRLLHIRHHYHGKPVLCIDDWSVDKNRITGLCGPNGSGKTTLLKLLGFIEDPTHGTVLFKGRKQNIYSGRVRSSVTFLPQESFLLRRSVYNNVAYGLRVRKNKGNEAARVNQALSLVGLEPEEFAPRPWYALSGGEARRVALAARLALRPGVLLLDEPTASVDAASAHLIKEAAVYAHRRWNTTLIISSHDLLWLRDICQDMLHLFSGKIFGSGRKTIIFGPWQKTEPGLAYRILSDGQLFKAGRAPEDLRNAAAVLDPEDLSLHISAQDVPAEKTALECRLIQLALEQQSGRIQASVFAGQTEFCIYLDAKTLSGRGFEPGKRVWLAYRPDRVKWHDA